MARPMQTGPRRQEILTWADVDKLMDVLLPQLRGVGTYDEMIIITRGGIIPGGLIAEALNVRSVLTASVSFPAGESEALGKPAALAALPTFLQFPDDHLLTGRAVLIVDDVWGSGRTSTAVRGRVEAAGGRPYNCVFHFNPYRSLFTKTEPDYYGAITDAYIVYPWELDRGLKGVRADQPLFSG